MTLSSGWRILRSTEARAESPTRSHPCRIRTTLPRTSSRNRHDGSANRSSKFTQSARVWKKWRPSFCAFPLEAAVEPRKATSAAAPEPTRPPGFQERRSSTFDDQAILTPTPEPVNETGSGDGFRNALAAAAVDQLDPVAVRVADEAEQRPALAQAVGLALRLDALPFSAASVAAMSSTASAMCP